MYFPLKLTKRIKLKDSPWSKVQNLRLSPNKILLADDSHFAIFDCQTRKIISHFEELNSFKNNTIALFFTTNTENVLLLLKSSKIVVFNTNNQSTTRCYSNLPRILKSVIIPQRETENTHIIKESKIKTILHGIHQTDSKHDFQTRSKLEIEWMDYENDSLIVIIKNEFLVHQCGSWYSYQRPEKAKLCVSYYEQNNQCCTAVQYNEDGILIFCQLTSNQMVCNEIQMPVKDASKVIIKTSQDGVYQAIALDQNMFIVVNKIHIKVTKGLLG